MPSEQQLQSHSEGLSFTEQDPSMARRKRRSRSSLLPTRVSSACERCRQHKSRCDPFRPCSLCVRANVDCRPLQVRKDAQSQGPTKRKRRNSRDTPPKTWNRVGSNPAPTTTAPAPIEDAIPSDSAEITNSQSSLDCGEAESAMGIARKICELGSQHIDEQTTSAIPGYRASTSAPVTYSATTAGQRLPISSILKQPLPPMEVVDGLLEDYFDAVHWFSLVVYEPKFRTKLRSVADGFAYSSQRPFLMLLAVMLGMAAWYRSQRRGSDVADNGGRDWRKWSADLCKLVEANLVELMDQPSVAAAQTCCLLGSYHVYHGRPNLSFSLLGATIKMSQAIGMHREPLRGSFEDVEERKRVWWTIYTWDRFASITYGRPLGINDKDCNINMPADVWESPLFTPQSDKSNNLCYSPYQRELNRLYLIASAALETIFGSRTSRTSKQLVGDTYAALVKEATQNLQKWKSCLPDHLILDLNRDFCPDGGPGSRAYALQSLSLHLTYDNLLIVLHRPLLARQVDHLSTTTNYPSPPGKEVDSPIPMAQSNLAQTASSELWMNAAVRTSRVTELPVLAQLATDSHLVAFLAINLFNAAIVLAVMALSEPLSDTAQDVKRTITRILRLQDLLGKRSALSKQSTTVLKNVVTMLLRRESAAMLAPITGTTTQQQTGQRVKQDQSQNQNENQNQNQSVVDPALMSVEDTLRLPLDATLESLSDPLAGSQGGLPDASWAHRLNESLTSVQYVMAPDDRSFNTPVGNQCESPEQGMQPSAWPLPADYEWDGTGVSPQTVEDSYHGDVEGGLYWLWDMAWNGAGG